MRLGYIILYVPDVQAAVGFYERAFGLVCRFVSPEGEYAELETGGTALAFVREGFIAGQGLIFTPQRAAEPPAGIEVALVTDDVPAAVDRARDAGAEVVKRPAEKPWGQTVAYVRDLNGMLVELCTPMG
jgi:catechol 2,3-dioxygenase-like lactoylglutathione lyase family enzyme